MSRWEGTVWNHGHWWWWGVTVHRKTSSPYPSDRVHHKDAWLPSPSRAKAEARADRIAERTYRRINRIHETPIGPKA